MCHNVVMMIDVLPEQCLLEAVHHPILPVLKALTAIGGAGGGL